MNPSEPGRRMSFRRAIAMIEGGVATIVIAAGIWSIVWLWTIAGDIGESTTTASTVVYALLLAGAVFWFRRSQRFTNEVQRCQRALAMATAVVLFIAALVARAESLTLALLIGIMPAWMVYRLLFVGMLRRFDVTDDRSLEQRIRPARRFIALLCVLGFMAYLGRFELSEPPAAADESDAIAVLAPLALLLLAYPLTTYALEHHIRGRLATTMGARAWM